MKITIPRAGTRVTSYWVGDTAMMIESDSVEIDGRPYVPPAPEPVQPQCVPREASPEMIDAVRNIVGAYAAAKLWAVMWDVAVLAGPEPDAGGAT